MKMQIGQSDIRVPSEVEGKKKPSYLRIIIRAYLSVLLMTVAIFILAGRVDYWQGWLFAATHFVFVVVLSIAFTHRKELIYERVRPGPGVKWWDKIFFALYIPSVLSIIFIAALDAGRFHSSPALPVALYPLALALLLLSYSVVLWAMWTNKFFSSRVRIQTDRGHYVIDTGPYRYIRHPGYAAAIVMLLSMAVLLGSLWALIPACVTVIAVLIRTYLEDVTLPKELPGYSDYTKKTKSRLIPGVW